MADGDVITVGTAKFQEVNMIPRNILLRNETVAVGDIRYSRNLPSYLRLECVSAGTTGATEPNFASMSTGGGIIVDGTCTWIVDDVRDGTPVGFVRASMYLPAGYVKCEGATVSRTDYPRLVALATEHSLWTSDTTNNPGLFGEGDGSTTMVLPNWSGRMAQFAATAGESVEAGLPNITGGFEILADNTKQIRVNCNGAFSSRGTNPTIASIASGNMNATYGCTLYASNSSSIYGSSQTVQPPAINTFAVMRY